MFPALEAEAQHAHTETNREVDLGGEAEWDKWSGSSKREEKTLGARRRELKAGKWFFAPTGDLQLQLQHANLLGLNYPTFCLQTDQIWAIFN